MSIGFHVIHLEPLIVATRYMANEYASSALTFSLVNKYTHLLHTVTNTVSHFTAKTLSPNFED